MTSPYQIYDRYELACPLCAGAGCFACRQGTIPVYVLVTGHQGLRCNLFGHDIVGHTERAREIKDLPHVAWCLHCSWQQIHTDVPEAYDVEHQPS